MDGGDVGTAFVIDFDQVRSAVKSIAFNQSNILGNGKSNQPRTILENTHSNRLDSIGKRNGSKKHPTAECHRINCCQTVGEYDRNKFLTFHEHRLRNRSKAFRDYDRGDTHVLAESFFESFDGQSFTLKLRMGGDYKVCIRCRSDRRNDKFCVLTVSRLCVFQPLGILHFIAAYFANILFVSLVLALFRNKVVSASFRMPVLGFVFSLPQTVQTYFIDPVVPQPEGVITVPLSHSGYSFRVLAVQPVHLCQWFSSSLVHSVEKACSCFSSGLGLRVVDVHAVKLNTPVKTIIMANIDKSIFSSCSPVNFIEQGIIKGRIQSKTRPAPVSPIVGTKLPL